MPQSHGTRRRTGPASARTRSEQRRGGRRRGGERGPASRRTALVPAPRQSPEELEALAASGPSGPSGGDGRALPDRYRPERRRRVWRLLTHNVTITVAGIAVLAGGVVFVDWDRVLGEAEPPKVATGGPVSTNDMLAKLQGSDMDAVTADSIAAAKERAYKEHQAYMKKLKEQAKKDAAARAKLKAEKEKERLAKSNPSAAQNKAYGKKMNAAKGWGDCWSSLLTLWNHESGWNERAVNPGSGAYGIPQALPGSKLASAGSDWRTSSPTQIAWGLGYIKARYHDPCGAWSWWSAHHWY
ncbi:aggregation-promoting factor C-terminal-like domain-containing protein [Actinomadura opuntiae]|uniref:aggregation-promoting factor C-terminal-like domain-containing protein n=1 Tax=Actinomadura sp. OS1-43 TaxID=604315 RepID=UPI00255B1A29|nr:lytic transglycosylase domain-containing protein [Actinomadura sp. OS1-43]MDL4818975.1 lytic transglycosylase domain-containing protein [Actinomadura sp. OS1-43]